MCILKDTGARLGMTYAGERTEYCRHLRFGTVAGIRGEWIRHEFGGESFVPTKLEGSLYRNNACFEPTNAR